MKFTKRLISIITVMCIIASLLTVAQAEEKSALIIDAPASVTQGETFTIEVCLPENTNALSGSFDFVYDSSTISINNCTPGSIMDGYITNISINQADKIRFVFDGDTPIQSGGTVLSVDFTVISSAQSLMDFKVEKFKLFDENFERIETVDESTVSTEVISLSSTILSLSCGSEFSSGDICEVTVMIENPSAVCGGSFNLVYDAEKFDIISVIPSDILSTYSKQINKTYAVNKVRMVWAGSSALTGSGEVTKFRFEVKDGAAGNCEFAIESAKLTDSNGNFISVSTGNSADVLITCTHSHMDWKVTIPATCTEPGIESYTCDCGYTTQTREISATGHRHFEWVTSTEATCTEHGTEQYVCEDCGVVADTREISPIGHNMDWVTELEADCENTGIKKYICSVCGYVEDTQIISAHGHEYNTVVTNPTRDEDGYTTHTCSACGHSYVDNEVPAIGYNITYNTQGGSSVPVKNKKKGEIVEITNTVPQKTGYTFVGWATVSDAIEAEYYAGNEYSEDADITLYAVWSVNQYTVTYKVDGEIYKVQTFNYNELIDAEAEPQKQGHTFSGWSDIPVTMPDRDVEVNGSFYVNVYTVTFDANGGENAPASIEADYSTDITIPSQTPQKENCVFVGWARTANTKRAQYLSEDSITVTYNIILYAVWTDIWDGSLTESGTLSGNGTRTNPYRVSNAADLALIAYNVNNEIGNYYNAYYIQTADIYLNDISNIDEWDTQPPANEWTPIGNRDKLFRGVYDGNGFKIGGIFINSEDSEQALFGFGSGCTISNVTLNSGKISGGYNTAGLIGGGIQINVIKCNIDLNLSGTEVVGAVVGLLKAFTASDTSQILDCVNHGKVSGNYYVGGILGSAEGLAVISDCSNYGVISNTQSGLGGIVGKLSFSSVDRCNNRGKISGNNEIGGIVGYAHDSDIQYSYNIGAISAVSTACGGIAGLADWGATVSKCYNVGVIEGANHYVGGICGMESGGNGNLIENCFNGATIRGYGRAGGICGQLGDESNINNCINTGAVYGTYKNAILGYNENNKGTVTSCFYLYRNCDSRYGTRLSIKDLSNTSKYEAMTFDSDMGEVWKIKSNSTRSWPVLKDMDDYVNIPIEFDLNGGSFDGYVLCELITAKSINGERSRDSLVIYNQSVTGTGLGYGGVEVIVNGQGFAEEITESGSNNSIVPESGFVLSGYGIMADWLSEAISVGDKVTYDVRTAEVGVYKKNPEFTYTPYYGTYLPTPHKDGYIFDGWYCGETKLSGCAEFTAYEPVKLTASWAKPNIIAETEFNGHYYLLFENSSSWNGANSYCSSIGGHLVTISDGEENSAVSALITNGEKDDYYIGCYYDEAKGDFTFVNGERKTFSRWDNGELSSDYGIGDAAYTSNITYGNWSVVDSRYFGDIGFICEIENTTLYASDIDVSDNISFDLKAYPANGESGNFVAAAYGENSKILDLKKYPYSNSVHISLDAQNADSVKVFWWSSLSEMYPYSLPYVFKINAD